MNTKRKKKRTLSRKQRLLFFHKKATNSRVCFSCVKKSPPTSAKLSAVGPALVVALGLFLMPQDASAEPYSARLGLPAPASIAADSALAMFLIGLAVGVPAGIGFFFFYLIVREKRETAQDRELDALLGGVSERRQTDRGIWGQGHNTRTRDPLEHEGSEERREPWERPADWWRDT
jgi:hypothetical protein